MSAMPAVIGTIESAGSSSIFTGHNDLDLVVEMAHDIRSPLSSILILAEALQEGQCGPVNQVQQRQLGLIYSAALTLCTSASDMIEMARGGDHLVDQRQMPFSVADVLCSVRDMVQPMVDETNIELRVVFPAVDRREGSPRSLARVLLNLTTNALKFTDSGFVEIAIREIDGAPGRVECSVEDTGCGMEPAILRSMFQPGRGSRSDLRQQLSSSGLGLAMCRKLLSAMGSTLKVETRSGKGTRFWFELSLPVAKRES